jgi:hypothetical protein
MRGSGRLGHSALREEVSFFYRLAAELERHFQRSAYRADDHLVFCHPHTGHPYGAAGTTATGASSTGSCPVSKTAPGRRSTWARSSRKASAVSRNPMRGVR